MRTLPKNAVLLIATTFALAVLLGGVASAQGGMPKSPQGSAATQIGDAWIEIEYSRPILRGRADIFGSGESYGKTLYLGAPVWRAGANVTTRIKTELDLMIGETKLPAGEYSFFIDLKEGAWTAIFSKQDYLTAPDRDKIQAGGVTWGAYGYSSDYDVLRAPMQVVPNEVAIDQLTYYFSDINSEGGAISLGWANTIGILPFSVAQ